nr:MAG: Transcription elongation factor Elf1 like [Bacteriophage sp.]
MEIVKKETANPCYFCEKELEVYPDEGGYRAKCSNCGVYTIACTSPESAIHAYNSVTHAYKSTLVRTSEVDNRAVLDDISALLEELK